MKPLKWPCKNEAGEGSPSPALFFIRREIQLGQGIGLGRNFQFRAFDMGVNLSGVQILVAQYFLNGFDIHTAGEHHGCRSMP